MSGAAAIITASVISAGATIYAGNKAASATTDASNAAIKEQQAALAQQKELAAPYTGLGQTAITPLEQLLGLTPGSTPGSQQAALANTPGYQFALQQGLQSTQAKANAMGMGLSGNTLAALDQYSTGLADQTYQQRVTNLQDVVGIGQAAAAGQAANIGQSAANIGNIQMAQGQTQAGLAMNEAAALGKIVGGAANQYTTINTLKGLYPSAQPTAYPTGGGYGAPVDYSMPTPAEMPGATVFT